MYLICEYYGEKPRKRNVHIRKVEPLSSGAYYVAVGGAMNKALCPFEGILHDHPVPAIDYRDISPICPTCRRLYKKVISAK